MVKSSNSNLKQASKAKKDEFYTQLSDIERELGHYKEHFKGKTVFCNCDDPAESNFYFYFAENFEFLGLRKLISTHYEQEKLEGTPPVHTSLDIYNPTQLTPSAQIAQVTYQERYESDFCCNS